MNCRLRRRLSPVVFSAGIPSDKLTQLLHAPDLGEVDLFD